MKFKYLFSAILSSAVLFSGCQEEESVGSFDNIKLSDTYLTVSNNGGNVTLTVTATEDWQFVVDENWPDVVSFNKDADNKTIKAKHDRFGNLVNDEADIKSRVASWLDSDTMSGKAGETKVTFTVGASEAGREIEIALYAVNTGNKQYLRVRQGSMEPESATCAEVIAGPDSKTYRVKGICTAIANTTYGNWYLNDGTGEIYIYGTLDKDGAEQNFSSWNLEVGDEIEVEGPKTTYGTTIELVNVTVLKLTKSLVKVVSEPAVLPKEANEFEVKVAYKGSGVFPTISDEYKSWISITDMKYVKGVPSKIEQNPADTAIVKVAVAANAGGARGGEIVFASAKGNASSSVTYTFTQDGSIKAVTVAEFLAAEEGESQYRVTGVVKSIKANAQYHNAEITILGGAGEELYIYRAVAAEGNIEDLGIVENDLITVVGKRGSHNGAPQMAQGGVCEKVEHFTPATIAEFLAAAEDATMYAVSGTITKLNKLDDNYNNVEITVTDGTNEVLLYRAKPIDDTKVSAIGLKVGGTVTVAGKRGSYNGAAQMAAGGLILKYVAGEGGDEPEIPSLYELDTTGDLQGTNNSYTGNCDVVSGDITWNVEGNTKINPWRIGGKSITAVDRAVYTKTAFTKEVSKVVLTLGTANATVNSCKLLYSTSEDFSNATEISFEYKNGAIDLVPVSGKFPANCYYKFVFNVTNGESSNKYVQFCKVAFVG